MVSPRSENTRERKLYLNINDVGKLGVSFSHVSHFNYLPKAFSSKQSESPLKQMEEKNEGWFGIRILSSAHALPHRCPVFPQGTQTLVSVCPHFLCGQTMYPLAVCMDWVILASYLHACYLSCSLSPSIWKHCCLEFYSFLHPRKTRSILLYFSINHFQGHSSTKMYNGGCFSWSSPTLLHMNAPFIEECLTGANI